MFLCIQEKSNLHSIVLAATNAVFR